MKQSNKWSQHWVLYDGECPMCRRCTSWIKRRDRRGEFIFAPAATAPGRPEGPMTAELRRACEDAVHIVTTRGEILRSAHAVFFALSRVWPSPLAQWAKGLNRAPWVWPFYVIYWLVAINRSRIGRFILPNEPVTVPEEYDG